MEPPKRKRVCRESIAPAATPTSGASGGGDAGAAANLTEEQLEQVRHVIPSILHNSTFS